MDLFQEGWIWWAIAIAVGVPIILVILTEVLGALTRRGSPAAKPVRLLRNWVVPVAALSRCSCSPSAPTWRTPGPGSWRPSWASC